MPSAKCFDAPTLKDYLLGKLSDEQSDVVAAHLEACLNCEATVAELDRASDTLTSGLRLPALAAEPATDDALQRALDKVQSFEPAADHHESSKPAADHSPVLRDYRLLEPLGSGGMGTVYKAVHTRLDRLVAVKLLPARRLIDEQAVSRFQREMRVIGQLSHPAIVQATDAGEVDGTHFLVMEYVEGCDLNTLAKACGPLSIADACEIARQAAVGLEYAHQQGIVHRDIKPSNLMLSVVSGPLSVVSGAVSHGQRTTDNGPTLKILDLGLALLSGVQAPVDELTTVGQLMGTLDYMAPEQLEDSHLVGPRADIYALAATLFRLLTGSAPFAKDDRKTPLQKLRALATQTAPPIRERRADIPEELAAIIDRALSRDSTARFASMSEFATALAPWCAGHDLAALAQRVVRLTLPTTDQGSSLPGSLSPWERAGVRETGVSRRDLGSQSLGNKPLAGERHRLNDRVPHPSPLPEGEGTGRRTPRRWLFTTLALLFLAVLGIVITIENNKGTLIVESLREGVEVRVKKSGKTVENFELTTGPKSARLTAGEYEIEILGDADGLQIQNGKFVLKRGDTIVAKVTERPNGQTVVEKPKPEQVEPAIEPKPRKSIEIIDLAAKGMDTFEESNPDLIGARKVREALQKKIRVEFFDLPLTECVAFLKEQSGLEVFIDGAALNEEGIEHDVLCTLSLKDVRIATALKFLLEPLQCAWTIDQGQVRITTLAKEKEEMVTRWYPVGRLLPGVRQAVERMNAEGPDIQGLGQGGFGVGSSGGGFFRVDDHAKLMPSRARQEAVIPEILKPLPDGRGSVKPPSADTELCMYGGAFNVTVEGHFEELFTATLPHQWANLDGEGGTFEFLQNVLVVRHTWQAHADIEALLRLIEAAFLKPLTEPIEIRAAGYATEADVATRKKLTQIVDADFPDVPLTDVADWIRERLDVQVLFDKEALENEGIGTDSAVTLHFKGISGELLLSRVLKPLQLDYQIEEGLLIVTTATKVKERLLTKVYDIRDLLDRGLHPSQPLRAIESSTPGPWLNSAGEGGSMQLFADTLLIIWQTPANHAEVTKFLAGLRSQLGDQPKVPRVIKPRPKTPLAVQPNPNEPKPTTPTPAKPTANNQPHYDGKSFDEWLAVLDTERSPARLTDAIEALRLLGRDTHAELIVERVLKAMRTTDFEGVTFGGNQRSIYSELAKLLQSVPAAVAQRGCAHELKNGTTRSRKFLVNNVNLFNSEEPLMDELLMAMLETCRDQDVQIRLTAVNNLYWMRFDSGKPKLIESRTAQLREALKDKVNEIAISAAQQLRDVEAESPAVAQALARIVAKPDHSNQRMVALNQLAVMGPRAVSVAPQLAAVLLEPPSNEATDVVDEFTDWLRPFLFDSRHTFHFSAAVALARMGPDAKDELPKIQKAIDAAALKPGEKNRQNVGPTNQIHWRDLLAAVQFRVAGSGKFDLRNADVKTLNRAASTLANNERLIDMEEALLHQFQNKPISKHEKGFFITAGQFELGLINSVRKIREHLESDSPKDEKLVEKLIYEARSDQSGETIYIQIENPKVLLFTELGKLGPIARAALPRLKEERNSAIKEVAEAAQKAIQQIEADKSEPKAN